MSAYIEKWCEIHKEWDMDVDNPGDCPECEKDGLLPGKVEIKRMTDKEPEKLATHGRIKTRCPSCGFDTLFISPSGWLTCSWLECKDPTAITNVESFAQRRVDDAVKKAVVNERTRCAAVIVGLRCRLLGRVSEDEMFTVEHSQKEIERGGGS